MRPRNVGAFVGASKEKSTCEFLRKCLIFGAPELGLEPRTL